MFFIDQHSMLHYWMIIIKETHDIARSNYWRHRVTKII